MRRIVSAPLVPELDIDHLRRSLAFYAGLVGFAVLTEREEDGFAYLALGGAQLMLEQRDRAARQFSDAAMAHPYGRGVNLQIRVDDADGLHARVLAAGLAPAIPLEERWYRQDAVEVGHRQFVVADPDGYLLRFFSDLGTRAAPARTM